MRYRQNPASAGFCFFAHVDAAHYGLVLALALTVEALCGYCFKSS
jgi:hypothetical protein